MEGYIPTSEELQKHISAAFDSVELINLNENDEQTIQRNIDHLQIMMGFEWFASALTSEQELQINAIING